MFVKTGKIAFMAITLLFPSTPSVFSEEVLTVPVPADTQSKTSRVGKPAVSKLKGVQNLPPFDLTSAKDCEAELKKRRIQFTILDKIMDPKGCLAERPLKLSSLSSGVILSRNVTARCEVVLALDNLISRIAIPSAKLHMDKKFVEVKTSTSYQCRTRNNAKGAKVSEHGFANGIDITGFKFADGTVMPVSLKNDKMSAKALKAAKFQAAIRAGACAYFTTVLGPGTNATHNDHLHFDLAHRNGGYRLCE